MAKLHGCALTNTNGCKQQNLLIMFCKHFGGKTKTIFYHFPEEWIMLSLLLANPPVKHLTNDRQIKQFYRGFLQCSPPLLAIQHQVPSPAQGLLGTKQASESMKSTRQKQQFEAKQHQVPPPNLLLLGCFMDRTPPPHQLSSQTCSRQKEGLLSPGFAFALGVWNKTKPHTGF